MQRTESSRTALGYGLLVITAIGWAGAWLTARVAAHDLPPLTVTLGRFTVAAVALLPAWFVLERRARLRLTLREWLMIVGMSLTGIVCYTVLFMLGVAYAPASDGAVITPGLAGVFALAISTVALGSRPGSRAIAGAVTASLGTLLVGWSAIRTTGFGSERMVGDVLFVVSAAIWGIYTVLGKALSDRVPAITGILACSVIGVIVLLPAVLLWDGVPRPGEWSPAAVVNVVYLGLGGTAVSFVTFYLAVKLIGIGRTAPALGLVPFFGVLGAALLLHERLVPLHAVGGLLVIAGILIPAVRSRAI